LEVVIDERYRRSLNKKERTRATCSVYLSSSPATSPLLPTS
jgi:hypothetical protein